MVLSLNSIKNSEDIEILAERLTDIITHTEFTKIMIKVMDQDLK